MRVQEPVSHRSGKLVAVIALNQRHHHVERGDTARTGDAVTVDLKQRRRDLDLGEVFAESGLMLPMQRRPVPVEKSGARENVGTTGYAADGHAAARQAAQPGEGRLVVEGRGIAAGTDEENIRVALAYSLRHRE